MAKFKRGLCLLLVVVMIGMLVVACGAQPGTTTTTTTAAGTAAEKTSEPAPAPAPADEKVTLTVALNMDVQDAYTAFFKKFNEKYPNITIDLTAMPPEIAPFIQARVASKDLPDVMTIAPSKMFSDLADNDMILDLKDTEAAKKLIDAVKAPFISEKKGKMYAVTYGLSSAIIYYNKEMFAKAGITAVPTNWDEFLAACEALKKVGIPAISLCPGDGTIGNTVFSFGFAANVVNKNPDWQKQLKAGQLSFNTPEVADIFAKAKTLVDKGYTQKGVISTVYQVAIDTFVQKKTAMYFGGVWTANNFQKTGFEVGSFLPPWGAKGEDQPTVISVESGWGVSQLSKNQDAALKVIDFFNGDGYLTIQNARMSVPAMKDPVQGTIVAPQVADLLPAILGAKKAGPFWFEIVPPATTNSLPKNFQSVMSGQMTPEAAAKQLDDEFKAGK